MGNARVTKVFAEDRVRTTRGAGGSAMPTLGEIFAGLRAEASVLDYIPQELHRGIAAGTEETLLTSYFEAAQAAAKKIIVPPGKYWIEYFDCESNRVWEGQGYESYLYNPQTNAVVNRQSIFGLGDMHPAAFKATPTTSLHLPTYATAAIAAGANSATLSTPANYTYFSVGQWVFVRTTEELLLSTFYYPYWGQIAKIVAIDSGTGKLTFDRPVKLAITTPLVCPIGGTTDSYMGIPWYICENVEISNLRVSARCILSTRTGGDRINIHDIWAEDSTDLLSLNCMNNSKFTNIHGPWSRRKIEVACYSQNVVTDLVDGPCSAVTGNFEGIDVHEQSSDIYINRSKLTIPATNTETGSNNVGVSLNGRDIFLDHCTIEHFGAGSGNPVALIYGNDFVGYGPDNIHITRTTLAGVAARTYHAIVGVDTVSEKPTNVHLAFLKTTGTPATGGIYWYKNTGLCTEVCNSLSVKRTVASTGANPIVIGSKVASANLSGGLMEGTGAPASSVERAGVGAIYARNDSAYPMNTFWGKAGGYDTGTNGFGTAGWFNFLLNTGFTARGDANASPNNTGSWIQYFNVSLTADRKCTLPALSAVDGGQMWFVVKGVAAGAGKLGAYQSDGTTLIAEIAAGSKGFVVCWWNGSSWSGVAVTGT